MLKRIGRYEIVEKLGQGGMATVYRAFDPRFKRDVALKLLPQQFLNDQNFRARFEREAHTIASLEHPAIVPVYDFGEQDDQLFLVMRYMDGGSLADRLERNGRMSLSQASGILRRLAPALDEAHAQGIVHRDLKPANILFDRRNLPYLADFGIVKVSAGGLTVITAHTVVIGTPAYMSPEQARGKKELDGRSDVYALGVVLFQMVTGALPYIADTPLGVALQHVTEPVPQIQEFNPSLPAECQDIIAKAMAKSREERFQTASALADSVTALAAKRATDPSRSIHDVTWMKLEQKSAADQQAAKLYSQAVAAMKEGEWEVAIIHFNSLLALAPDYRDTVARLSEANRQKRMAELLEHAQRAVSEEAWDKALPLLQQILEIDSGHQEAQSLTEQVRLKKQLEQLYVRAQKALAAKQWERAVAVLQEITTLQAGYRDVPALLKKARAEHQRLRQINRHRDESRRALEEGRWETAIKAFEAWLALAPSDHAARKGLREAQSEFEAASHYAAGQEAAQQADLERAIDALQQALALRPDNRTYQQYLAELQNQKALVEGRQEAEQALTEGQWERALARTERLLQQVPEDAHALELLRRAERQKEKSERRQALYQRATAASEQKRWPEAVAAWEELVQLVPEEGEAAQQLARARRQLAEEAEARKQAQAAQEEQAAQEGRPAKTQLEKTALDRLPSEGKGTETEIEQPEMASPATTFVEDSEAPRVQEWPKLFQTRLMIVPLLLLLLLGGYAVLNGRGATPGGPDAGTLTPDPDGGQDGPAAADSEVLLATETMTRRPTTAPSSTSTPKPSRTATATSTRTPTSTSSPTRTPTTRVTSTRRPTATPTTGQNQAPSEPTVPVQVTVNVPAPPPANTPAPPPAPTNTSAPPPPATDPPPPPPTDPPPAPPTDPPPPPPTDPPSAPTRPPTPTP